MSCLRWRLRLNSIQKSSRNTYRKTRQMQKTSWFSRNLRTYSQLIKFNRLLSVSSLQQWYLACATLCIIRPSSKPLVHKIEPLTSSARQHYFRRLKDKIWPPAQIILRVPQLQNLRLQQPQLRITLPKMPIAKKRIKNSNLGSNVASNSVASNVQLQFLNGYSPTCGCA